MPAPRPHEILCAPNGIQLENNKLIFTIGGDGGKTSVDLSAFSGSGFTVDGTPTAGQVPKYQMDGSVKWADDLTAMAGSGDGVVDTLTFSKTAGTFTLTAGRTESLADVASNTFQVDWADIQNQPTLFSGAYADLTGLPTLFSGDYNDLTNKPTLFSGSYNDLTNKPTIPNSFLSFSDTPNSWDPLWSIPAVNTSRDGLFWIAGPVGWAQRGNSSVIPIEKLGTGHVSGEMTRFLREDGTFVAPGGLNQNEVDARVNVGLDRLSFTKTNPSDTIRLLFQDSDGSPSNAVSLDHTDIGSTLRGLSHPAANKVLSYTSSSTLPEWSHVEALLALVSGYGDGKVLTGRTNMSPTWQDPTGGGGMDNRIIFPDAMGMLRAGVADDWDAPNSLSKVFAWTGNHLQRINRVPVPKTATFTPVPDGTNLGGTTNPRWRTFHHNDGQVPSPQNNDLYYNLTNNVFRYRQGGNWSNLSANHFAITGAGIVSGTLFADQPAALAFPGLTANDQRIMYGAGGTENLYTTSAFMAAHNSYPWQDVYADWTRSEDLSIIPQVKLGTGMATATTFLRGDGQWATPTGMGGTGEPEAFTDASYTFSVPLSSGTIRFTRANNTTFDLTMLMPFVNAQTVRNSIVEPWATRGESDLVPLAKLDGPVTSIGNWIYNLGTRRQSLTVNRINEPNITLQGPVFPEWITATDVVSWAAATSTDDIPPARLGSGARDGTRFLRDDGAWSVLPNSLVTNLVSSWALVGDTTIIPNTKLPSFIVPVYDWAKAGNSDIIPPAKLGSGSPSSANFLRGDGTWQVITAGGGTPVNVTKETLKVVRYGTTYEVVGSILESHSSNQQAHGMGQLPDGFEMYLECTTPDKSYSVGDKVYTIPPPWRETVHYDATNIYVYTRNQGWGIMTKGSTTGASSNIDLSDWKIVIKPYIYEDKSIVTDVTGGGGSGYDNFIQLDDTPASYGTAGQFVAMNSSGNGLVFVNAPSGGGTGDDAFDWATVGNTDTIPIAKIPNFDANKITTGVFDYRRIAAGVFGANKVPAGNTAGTGLEWADLPTSYPGNDAIKDLIGASTFADDPLSVTYDGTTRTLRFTSTARTEAQVNTQIESRRDFEWCSATVTATSTAVTIALDGEGTAAVSTERILAINYISTFPATRPDSLPVFVSYNGQNSGNVQLFGADNSRRNMTLGDLRTYGHTNVMHMFRRRSGGWDWVGTSGAASVAQDVTSLIKPWALTANASTRVPVGQMGSGTASSSTWLRGDGSWQSLPALTDQQIATLVNGSPGNNRIIGYDTGDAGLRWYDLPTVGGMADGVVDDITHSISGQNLTLTLSRTNNLADISEVIALPAGTDTNNYVTGGSVSGTTLTLTRQGLGDVSITGLPSGGGGTSTPDLYKVGNSDVTYTTTGGRRRVSLAISGADNSVGTLVLFQYSDSTLTPDSTEVEVGVNNSSFVRIKWDNPVGGSLENITLGDITRYNYYMLYRAGSFWHKVGGTVEALGSGGTGLTETQVRALIADWAEEGNLTNIPVAKLGNVHSWARAGNTDRLPENKMTGYPTGFSITAAGAQTIQWQMQRQGLTNLTDTSILLPGLPSTISGSLSGTDLTIIMSRTGTGGNITSSTIDLSGLSGGGGTVSDEHIRDTTAAFATEGVGIAIHHDDPGNKLIFSADPHFEQVQTLVLINHVGNAFRLNRDRPSDLFQVGTNVPGTSTGATYHRDDRRVYVVTTAGNIQRSSVNALSGWSSVGTLPTGRGAYQGLASNGTDIYALSENGLTQVNLSNVGSSTYAGDWPAGMFGIGGGTFHLDVLQVISASTRKVHTVADLTSPGSAVDEGRMPTGFVGVPHLLVSAGGRLYTLESHTNGVELWEVNPDTPGSSRELGQVQSSPSGTITAGVAIDVRLDTTYIPEGNNLYFTNERVDDRVNSLVLVDTNQLLEKTYNDSANRLTLKVDIEHTETTSPTAFMERLTMANVTRQVRNTFEIENVGQLPPLTENILGQMYFNKADREIYVGIDEPHTQNTPSGTFNAISARSDLHVVTAFPANLNNLTAGDFYYLHGQGWNDGFYVVAVRYGVNELVATSASSAFAASRTSTSQGVVWLGAEQRATDALRFTYSVDSGDDYFWLDLGAAPPTFKILDQSTFVAAGGTTHHYQFWRAGGGGNAASWAQAGNTDRIPTSKLGSGTASSSNFLRGDGSWQSIPAASPQIMVGHDESAMASYWDATDSLSSRLKWTGFGFQRIKRELVGQHGASATFTEVSNNTTFTVSGTTYRWRGAHQYDHNVSANVNDFYFKWSTGRFRVFRDGPGFTTDYWEDIDGRDIISTYIGDYNSQSDALSHVGANDQYVIYTTSGTDRLYRVSSFTAASSGTPNYSWEDWEPWSGGVTHGDVLGLISANVQDWAETGNTSAVPISKGGTGATTASGALTNLGALGSVATDNTINGDGTSSSPLSVSANDVIEELQESIQHFTSGSLNYSGRGASIGHCFTSGPYRTQISRVTVSLDVPNSGGTYVARIFTLESNNRIKTHLANSNTRNLSHRRNEAFDFTAGGHTIPTNTRIAVLISRTDDGNDGDARMRYGAEASNSPSESYDDASIDFNRHGWVEYEHTNPPANTSTHNHDTDNTADAYGDMRIQYRRTFDHGTLVGDGNVSATHIDSDGAAVGRALFSDGSDGARWEAAARLGEQNEFTAAQEIDHDGTALTLDSSTYTGNHPGLIIRTGPSGHRRVLEGWAGSSSAWLSILAEVSGANKPGIEIGEVGGSSRDVYLYRDAADVWRTPDAFHVGELRVDSSGRSNSRTQLGLGDAAVEDAGDSDLVFEQVFDDKAAWDAATKTAGKVYAWKE